MCDVKVHERLSVLISGVALVLCSTLVITFASPTNLTLVVGVGSDALPMAILSLRIGGRS